MVTSDIFLWASCKGIETTQYWKHTAAGNGFPGERFARRWLNRPTTQDRCTKGRETCLGSSVCAPPGIPASLGRRKDNVASTRVLAKVFTAYAQPTDGTADRETLGQRPEWPRRRMSARSMINHLSPDGATRQKHGPTKAVGCHVRELMSFGWQTGLEFWHQVAFFAHSRRRVSKN